MWWQSRCQLRKNFYFQIRTGRRLRMGNSVVWALSHREVYSEIAWCSIAVGKQAFPQTSMNFRSAIVHVWWGAAHFKRSNCHTAPTILSCFDVRFKGLQSCQRLSSDTSPAMNRAGSEVDLSTLCFSSTQDRTDILEPGDPNHQRRLAEEVFRAHRRGTTDRVMLQNTAGRGPVKVQHTHKQTLRVDEGKMAEDGWSGQGDMTAERLGEISGRQTSFLSTPNRLMCVGLG